jgi:hypothetical protein
LETFYFVEGCYKDRSVLWWQCWNAVENRGGVIPECTDQNSCGIKVFPGNSIIPSSGPHITRTFLRYLSCEKGKWKLRKYSIGQVYTWENGEWTSK